MIRRCNAVMISFWTTAVCLSSKQARSEDLPYDAAPTSPVGVVPEAPQEQPPASIWNKMSLRFEGVYARGHVFDVPFGGGQFLGTIGMIKGPLTGFVGADVFLGSTEAGLGTFAQHFDVGADLELWRFRVGGAIFAGFSSFSRASGSSVTDSAMSTTESGMWGEASFDVVRLESGGVPIALVIGARVYGQFASDVTWSPAFFAGVQL